MWKLLPRLDQQFLGGIRFAFVEESHRLDADEFDQVGRVRGTRGLAGADFAGDLQGLVRDLAGQEHIGQRETGVPIVRLKLQRAGELQRRLPEKALRGVALTEPETEAGIVNRPVDRQQRVPVPIAAEFLIQRLARFDRRHRAGAQCLVAIQIDLGRDISRIQFAREFKILRCFFQAPEFLQFNAPPVQGA